MGRKGRKMKMFVAQWTAWLFFGENDLIHVCTHLCLEPHSLAGCK